MDDPADQHSDPPGEWAAPIDHEQRAAELRDAGMIPDHEYEQRTDPPDS